MEGRPDDLDRLRRAVYRRDGTLEDAQRYERALGRGAGGGAERADGDVQVEARGGAERADEDAQVEPRDARLRLASASDATPAPAAAGSASPAPATAAPPPVAPAATLPLSATSAAASGSVAHQAPAGTARHGALIAAGVGVLGALVLGVLLGGALSRASPAYLPAASGSPAPLPTALDAPSPPLQGRVLVTADGRDAEEGTSEVDARGAHRFVSVLCQGAGSVQVQFSDGAWSNYACGTDSPRRTFTYEASPHGRFDWAVVPQGDVAWALTVSTTR